MTELADVQDLGSCAFRRVGSSERKRPGCILTESSKSQPTASIAWSNKQLFGYEQVAKRIANIRFDWNTE